MDLAHLLTEQSLTHLLTKQSLTHILTEQSQYFPRIDQAVISDLAHLLTVDVKGVGIKVCYRLHHSLTLFGVQMVAAALDWM